MSGAFYKVWHGTAILDCIMRVILRLTIMGAWTFGRVASTLVLLDAPLHLILTGPLACRFEGRVGWWWMSNWWCP